MGSVISIRVEDDVVADIERLGFKPGEYLKRILENEIRKDRSRLALGRLRARMAPKGPEPAQTLIRRDRDSR